MKRRTIFIVCFSLFIDLFSFTLILPLFPSIFQRYATNDESGIYSIFENQMKEIGNYLSIEKSLNKVLISGLLGSWFSFLQFLSSPIIGSLSDIFGRKPLLIFSLIGTLFSQILWIFSTQNFAIFLISRTIGGLSKCNVTLSTAILSDLTSKQERGKAMAFIGISFSIAFILGPMCGAFMSKQFSRPAYCATILSIINLIFVILCFHETLRREQQEDEEEEEDEDEVEKKKKEKIGKNLWITFNDYINPVSIFSFNALVSQRRRRRQQLQRKDLNVLRTTGWIYFLYLFLYSGLEYSLSFLTFLRFNFSNMQQGKMYLYCGLLMTLFQSTFVRRINPGNELRHTSFGLLSIIVAFTIVGLSTSTFQLFFGLTFYSFSSAVIVPCLTTLASKIGRDDEKGTVLGIFRSIGALARAFGPVFASILFWKFGSTFCYCFQSFLFFIPFIFLRNLQTNKT